MHSETTSVQPSLITRSGKVESYKCTLHLYSRDVSSRGAVLRGLKFQSTLAGWLALLMVCSITLLLFVLVVHVGNDGTGDIQQ